MRRTIIDAARAHAQGHIEKAKANVEVYLKNPTGIGEHSDVVETIEKEVEKIADASDKISAIRKHF